MSSPGISKAGRDGSLKLVSAGPSLSIRKIFSPSGGMAMSQSSIFSDGRLTDVRLDLVPRRGTAGEDSTDSNASARSRSSCYTTLTLPLFLSTLFHFIVVQLSFVFAFLLFPETFLSLLRLLTKKRLELGR